MPLYFQTCRYTFRHAVILSDMPLYFQTCRYTFRHAVILSDMPLYFQKCMRNFDVSFSKHLKCYEILIAGEWLFNVEYSLLSCSIPSPRFIPSAFCPLFRVLSPFPFPQFCVLSLFPCFILVSAFYPLFRVLFIYFFIYLFSFAN